MPENTSNFEKGDSLEIDFRGAIIHGDLIDRKDGRLILKLKSGYDIALKENEIIQN
jgi:hypothetical protein